MERALQADLFREEKEQREISLKLQGNNLWKSLKIRRKYSLKRENKVEMGLFCTQNCASMCRKSSFLWFQRVFPQTERQVFHNIMESLMKKSANELLYN